MDGMHQTELCKPMHDWITPTLAVGDGCLVNKAPIVARWELMHSYNAGADNKADKACMQKAPCTRQTTSATKECIYNHTDNTRQREGDSVCDKRHGQTKARDRE